MIRDICKAVEGVKVSEAGEYKFLGKVGSKVEDRSGIFIFFRRKVKFRFQDLWYTVLP